MNIKQTLTDYEKRFPDDAVTEVAFALTQQELELSELVDIIEDSLKNELADADMSNTQTNRDRLRKLRNLCEKLSKIEVTQTDIRQYNTEDKTPQEINEQGKNGTFGLLTHSSNITGSGSIISYPLSETESAIIVRRESHLATSPFRVKYSNQYYGTFEVYFANNVDQVYHNNLKDDGWMRPTDIKQTQSSSDKTAKAETV